MFRERNQFRQYPRYVGQRVATRSKSKCKFLYRKEKAENVKCIIYVFFKDRVESRSYICSRSGSNTSNTGSISSNVNKNIRMDHQGIAGGSLRISSTSTSANNGK